MTVRKIITIDEEKCDGCGLCAEACHEGAIRIVDGKARLISDIYCDGLGDCLKECPQDAIQIVERESKAFDAKAVEAHLAAKQTNKAALSPHPVGGGCPGSALRNFMQKKSPIPSPKATDSVSCLGNWPVQLKLVPPGAPFLKEADLLICADCVPFAVPDFHANYLAGKALLIGCPKLDDLAFYEEKLKAIFAEAAPRSITVLKMEVPCCNGIAQVAIKACEEACPGTELKVYTIGIQGAEIESESVNV
ncbi:MAG: 4Fe-4S binding protein [Planctomycetota bacterium]